jgi:hypothetical protein
VEGFYVALTRELSTFLRFLAQKLTSYGRIDPVATVESSQTRG